MIFVDRRPYNQVIRCAGDPLYDPSPVKEDLTMLYRPLFWTSFWCEDWLFHGFPEHYRGATNFLISSASAKTAFALAYCIKRRVANDLKAKGLVGKVNVVGLTSSKNVEFTKGLGLYDSVLEYGTFKESGEVDVKGEGKWVYLDVSGNDDLNQKVYQHFVQAQAKDKLVSAVMLGLTTLSPSASAQAESVNLMKLPESASSTPATPKKEDKLELETFFTVEWLAHRRANSLTVPQIAEMQAEAWAALMRDGQSWVRLERLYGAEKVKAEYERIGKHGLGPEVGQIWSLWDSEEQLETKNEIRKANL